MPAQIDGGWTTSTPESVGLDSQVLCGVVHWLDSLHGSNIHSVLVVRRGSLVFEHYRKGTDERWRDPIPDAVHGSETKHDLRSATKSVRELLVGLAVDRKPIPGLDEPVLRYSRNTPTCGARKTPHPTSAPADNVCWPGLGRACARHRSDARGNANVAFRGSAADGARTAGGHRAGEIWKYSGGCTEILGALLHNCIGKLIDELAHEALLESLGIADVDGAAR